MSGSKTFRGTNVLGSVVIIIMINILIILILVIIIIIIILLQHCYNVVRKLLQLLQLCYNCYYIVTTLLKLCYKCYSFFQYGNNCYNFVTMVTEIKFYFQNSYFIFYFFSHTKQIGVVLLHCGLNFHLFM